MGIQDTPTRVAPLRSTMRTHSVIGTSKTKRFSTCANSKMMGNNQTILPPSLLSCIRQINKCLTKDRTAAEMVTLLLEGKGNITIIWRAIRSSNTQEA